MLFNYTQKKMTHLSQPQANMSSIREGCDSLGTDCLSTSDDKPWAIGGLQVNSTSGEGGLISFPLVLLKGNAILLITSKTGCDYCY